jgi:hypothetical protein
MHSREIVPRRKRRAVCDTKDVERRMRNKERLLKHILSEIDACRQAGGLAREFRADNAPCAAGLSFRKNPPT